MIDDAEDDEVVLMGVLDAVFEGVVGVDNDFEKKYAMPMRIMAPMMMIAMISFRLSCRGSISAQDTTAEILSKSILQSSELCSYPQKLPSSELGKKRIASAQCVEAVFFSQVH